MKVFDYVLTCLLGCPCTEGPLYQALVKGGYHTSDTLTSMIYFMPDGEIDRLTFKTRNGLIVAVPTSHKKLLLLFQKFIRVDILNRGRKIIYQQMTRKEFCRFLARTGEISTISDVEAFDQQYAAHLQLHRDLLSEIQQKVKPVVPYCAKKKVEPSTRYCENACTTNATDVTDMGNVDEQRGCDKSDPVSTFLMYTYQFISEDDRPRMYLWGVAKEVHEVSYGIKSDFGSHFIQFAASFLYWVCLLPGIVLTWDPGGDCSYFSGRCGIRDEIIRRNGE